MKNKKLLYYAGGIVVILLYWLFTMGPLKGVTDGLLGTEADYSPTPTYGAVIATSTPTAAPTAELTKAPDKPTGSVETTVTVTPTNTPTTKPTDKPEPTKIPENGTYTSKNDVALYIHTYSKLPSNFIKKKDAEALGWKSGNNSSLDKVAPGKSIGGDSYGNYEKLLPTKSGRKYYECDIDYKSGNRNSKRIVYSNDGLIYYTDDHYESFTLLYGNP